MGEGREILRVQQVDCCNCIFDTCCIALSFTSHHLVHACHIHIGKEATRLLLEINKERRRLAELQEQHGDLLGLLAQQVRISNSFLLS